MTVSLRCTLLAVGGALATSLVVLAPSAAALPPGCDWNTDAGTQACMGGGPFDAGKNGNGDTYGPSGEAGFIYDTKLVLPSVRKLSDAHLLKIGHQVCENRRRGHSEDAVKEAFAAAFKKIGLDPSDAGYMVIDAEMYLCPNL
ncbi:DUF732 domain-containing protein [Mycobacterium sp. NPDC049093]